MHPVPPEEMRYGRVVEFWSAISISLLLLRLTVVLASLTVAVLAVTFAFEILVLAIAVLAFVVLADNVRELRR